MPKIKVEGRKYPGKKPQTDTCIDCPTCEGYYIEPEWEPNSYKGFINYVRLGGQVGHQCKQENWSPKGRQKSKTKREPSVLGERLCELLVNESDADSDVMKELLREMAESVVGSKGSEKSKAIEGLLDMLGKRQQIKQAEEEREHCEHCGQGIRTVAIVVDKQTMDALEEVDKVIRDEWVSEE